MKKYKIIILLLLFVKINLISDEIFIPAWLSDDAQKIEKVPVETYQILIDSGVLIKDLSLIRVTGKDSKTDGILSSYHFYGLQNNKYIPVGNNLFLLERYLKTVDYKDISEPDFFNKIETLFKITFFEHSLGKLRLDLLKAIEFSEEYISPEMINRYKNKIDEFILKCFWSDIAKNKDTLIFHFITNMETGSVGYQLKIVFRKDQDSVVTLTYLLPPFGVYAQ